MKECNKCKISKPIEAFHKASRNIGGRYHTCKKCRKDIDASYYKTSNKKLSCKNYKDTISSKISEYKRSKGCLYCTENEPVALDFHHTGNNKEFTIANKRTLSWKRLLLEIAKCVVICANCHRKLHAGLI